MRSLVISFIFILLCMSCRSPKVITETLVQTDTVHVTHDSVVIREHFVPIEIEIPSSSQSVVIPITRDTASILEDEFYISVAEVSEGNLHHTLKSKRNATFHGEAMVRDTVKTSIDSLKTKNSKEVQKVKEVNRLTKWQKFIQLLGYCFLAAAIYLLFYFAKKLLKWKI